MLLFYKKQKCSYGATIFYKKEKPDLKTIDLVIEFALDRWRSFLKDFDERFGKCLNNLKIVFHAKTKYVQKIHNKIFVQADLKDFRFLLSREIHRFILEYILPKCSEDFKEVVIKRVMKI